MKIQPDIGKDIYILEKIKKYFMEIVRDILDLDIYTQGICNWTNHKIKGEKK